MRTRKEEIQQTLEQLSILLDVVVLEYESPTQVSIFEYQKESTINKAKAETIARYFLRLSNLLESHDVSQS